MTKSKQISELFQKRGFNGDYAIAALKVNTSCCYYIRNTYIPVQIVNITLQ